MALASKESKLKEDPETIMLIQQTVFLLIKLVAQIHAPKKLTSEVE